MKAFIITTWLCLVACTVGCSNESEPKQSKYRTDNPLKSALDIMIDSLFKEYFLQPTTAGFSIAVIEKDNVFQYHYGETKLGNMLLPNSTTLYEIGSITKTFTAGALVHWLNEQKIDIDSPIYQFLPDSIANSLRLNSVNITFRQLLNHTSGLPRIPANLPNNNNPYKGYDSTKIYSYLKNNLPLRTPGMQPSTEQDIFYYYSNLAYGLAGILLERQYQKSLHDILLHNIFRLYGMTSTTLDNIENRENRAYPTNAVNNATYWHFSGMAGAGGAKSTLQDMIGYVKRLLNNNNSISIDYAFTRTLEPEIRINGKDYIGLGWEFYYTKLNKRIVVKDGGTGGFTAFVAFDKSSQKGIVALFNNDAENSPSRPFVALLDRFFQE